MRARPQQSERVPGALVARSVEALKALAEAGVAAATASSLREGLGALAEATARAAGADVAVIRVVYPAAQCLTACAVASASSAIEAELEGTRFPISDLALEEVDDLAALPEAVARAAKRVRATAVLQLPIRPGDEPEGSIELLRADVPFSEAERALARLAVAQAGLVIRCFDGTGGLDDDGATLALAGDALAAGAGDDLTAEQVVRLTCRATGAVACLLWRLDEGRPPALVASAGLGGPDAGLVHAGEAAERAWVSRDPVAVEEVEGKLPAGAAVSATLQLGQPPMGALQLLFPAHSSPTG